MTANYVSVFNQLRPLTIGFDSAFDLFEQMFRGDLHQTHQQGNYPPYNIEKTGDFTYDIQLALAGFTKKDVSVKYADNELTISSNHEKWDDDKKQSLVHQGISKRKFTRTFTLADDIEIKEAELKDGLLTVSLEKIIPDNKKPRTIKIQ
tara:strand:+ start:2361 stop:2807 length:447 start_codon:yes stop_codon:yes gene_type:complete